MLGRDVRRISAATYILSLGFCCPPAVARLAPIACRDVLMLELGSCLGTSRPAGRHCPSIESVGLARAAAAGPHLNHQRKETTAAARRSARGVPQAGLRGRVVSRIRPMEASRPTAPARGAHNHSPSLNQLLARGRGARQASKGKPLLPHRARRPGERMRTDSGGRLRRRPPPLRLHGKAPTHPKVRAPDVRPR